MQDDIICEITSHLDVVSTLRLLQTSKRFWNLRHKPMIQDRIVMYHYHVIRKQWNKGLMMAISRLDIPNVLYFLDKGADDMNTAMYEAATRGNEYLVRLFVSRGASRWHLGLCYASQGGNMNLVEFFESKGAYNVNEAFVFAAKGGHRDLMDYFIEKGATRIGAALQEAAERHNMPLIEYLITIFSGWSHYSATQFWNHGMWGALKGTHMDLFDFFMAKGANNINVALRFAAEKGNLPLCQYLVQQGASKIQGLKGVAEGGQIQTLKYFMQFDYDDMLHDIFFNAARNGHRVIVDMLIDRYHPSTELEKALEGACVGGHAELVQFCMEKGAKNYSSCLAGAAGGGHRTLVEFFLQYSQALTAQSYQHALLKAIEGGFFRIVELLSTQVQHNWNDALFKAAQFGDMTLVKYCVEKGANDWQRALGGAKLVPCRSVQQYLTEKIQSTLQ